MGVEQLHATDDQAYMFEQTVVFKRGDGSTSAGRIECYRRDAFVLEAKKLKVRSQAGKTGARTKGFDVAMMRARPGRGLCPGAAGDRRGPPLPLMVDVGHVIELYAKFTRSGGT